MNKWLESDSSESRRSLYLLGNSIASSLVERCALLMKLCEGRGQFLSYVNSKEFLSCYERDAQKNETRLPILVFRPHGVSDIPFFVKACSDTHFPIAVRCGGTGYAGGCVPEAKGVVLLTSHLNKIKEYDVDRGVTIIDPGVTVSQLNRYVNADQWNFPLRMASEGVAGIAACLSSHARPYHRQQDKICDLIQSVILVDGCGSVQEVPSSFVCGAEGLWGIIIELKIRLKKKPKGRKDFIFLASWSDLFLQLPLLCSLQSLVFLTWIHEKFYLGLEGDLWRLNYAIQCIKTCFPSLQPLQGFLEDLNLLFLPKKKQFIVVSSVLAPFRLPAACDWSIDEAHHLNLDCLQQADVLSGSLHLILESEESFYSFDQKVKQFLVGWTNFLISHGGALASCHGVGLQMRRYMTPFWNEETQKIWRALQLEYDPKQLFGSEQFFPPMGSSLEKVSNESADG